MSIKTELLRLLRPNETPYLSLRQRIVILGTLRGLYPDSTHYCPILHSWQHGFLVQKSPNSIPSLSKVHSGHDTRESVSVDTFLSSIYGQANESEGRDNKPYPRIPLP